MGRYGGAAEVGRIIKLDDTGYGPPPPTKSNTRRNVGIAGVGLSGVGLHQALGSKKVKEQAWSRQAAAEGAAAGAKTRLDQAMTNAARLEAKNVWGRRGTRWLNTGKRREASRRLEQAQVEHARAARTAERTAGASTLKATTDRARSMRRVGGGLMLGGAALTASQMLGRRNVEKAEVSKTITQARYGSHAEKGRAWRGEEKRDVPRALHVVGAGGTAAIGGGLTAAAGHRALKRVGRTSKIPEIEREGAEIKARVKRAEELVERAKQQHKSARVHREVLGQHQMRLNEVPKQMAAEQARLHSAGRTARRLRGGGAAVAALGGAAALGAGIKMERDRRPYAAVRKDLREDLEGNVRVSREMEDLKSIRRRLKTLPEEDKFALEQKVRGNIRMREGKEEKDSPRKVKRRLKDLPREDKFALEQDLHARPIKMSKSVGEGKAGRGPKLKKIFEDSKNQETGKMKKKDLKALRLRGEHDLGERPSGAKAQDKGQWIHKALPIGLALRTGLAATKMVTPKPIRNTLRPIRQGYDDAYLRAAEKRAYREAGMRGHPFLVGKAIDPKKIRSLSPAALGGKGILRQSKLQQATEAKRAESMARLKAMTPEERQARTKRLMAAAKRPPTAEQLKAVYRPPRGEMPK